MLITSKVMSLRVRTLPIAGLAMLCASWVGSALADEDYLKSLEAEASDVTVDQAGTLDGPANRVEPEQDGIPDDLDRPGFEDMLRSRYIGSFMFYNKLSDGDKSAVFGEYQNSKDIELIRKKIISLFSSN